MVSQALSKAGFNPMASVIQTQQPPGADTRAALGHHLFISRNQVQGRIDQDQVKGVFGQCQVCGTAMDKIC